MGFEVSLEKALDITKFSVYLACTWPPSDEITKWKSVKLDILWSMSLLSSLCLLLPLLYSIYEHQSNSFVLTQSICFVGAICNFIVKMIVYRLKRKQTQILINEMESFVKIADPRETMFLQSYVNRTSTFHAIIIFWNYTAAAVAICGPFFLPQRFPTDAIYPFTVDSTLITWAIYAHQSFVGFQCSTGASIDCQTAMMMWYAAARLEILANQLKTVNDVDGFHNFIRQHQRTLVYAREVSRTMRYIALTTSIMAGLGTVFSGLQLLSDQPFAVKILFAPIALIATMNLFVCSWSADNLIKVCEIMGSAGNNTTWIDLTPEMKKYYLMVLKRTQQPVTVSIGGFLPTLSLRSYAAYLSTAFSYTTTLHLIINSDN